jgi:hypothetical protein
MDFDGNAVPEVAIEAGIHDVAFHPLPLQRTMKAVQPRNDHDGG